MSVTGSLFTERRFKIKLVIIRDSEFASHVMTSYFEIHNKGVDRCPHNVECISQSKMVAKA